MRLLAVLNLDVLWLFSDSLLDIFVFEMRECIYKTTKINPFLLDVAYPRAQHVCRLRGWPRRSPISVLCRWRGPISSTHSWRSPSPRSLHWPGPACTVCPGEGQTLWCNVVPPDVSLGNIKTWSIAVVELFLQENLTEWQHGHWDDLGYCYLVKKKQCGVIASF